MTRASVWAVCGLLGAAVAGAADPPPRSPPKYETRADHDPDGIGKFYLGREIAHVMGYQGAGWLDRPTRVEEEEPAKLLKALDVKPGMVVADVGAGSGYHTFRLAPLVGETGKVIASDIQPEMLKIVEARAKQKKVKNVEAVNGTVKDPKLPAGGVDLILLVDVYHEFEFPFEMAEKMVAALKPGGRLVFVEFKAEDPAVPIKPVHKMTERQVLKEMEPFPELEHAKTTPLSWQHVIVFTKKAEKK
ncbi:MAG: class I SAM-dependent methyltransferase [Gemmataceae bacterium]|nr:class I SAM-dependent methyltransferase [Gemmataceae bacterium]